MISWRPADGNKPSKPAKHTPDFSITKRSSPVIKGTISRTIFMDFLLSQPNESAGYIMEISPDSIITHLTAVSLVLPNLFLNSTGQVEGVRGICICLQFSCKQGVPYKEPQKNPVLRNAKPSDGLLGRGSSPMEQAAASHTTGRGAIGLRRQIPQFTHPRHEYPPFVSAYSRGEFQPFSSF